MDIAFLDSWPADPARGSGTAVGISGLAAALEAAGHRVDLLRPARGGGSLSLRRLMFNAELEIQGLPDQYDLVAGFDIDGCFYRPGPDVPYIVCLKGIAAEEAQFETGRVKAHLSFLARMEGYNARKARAVFVTSNYCKRAAVSAYDLPPGNIEIVPEGIDLAAWEEAAASVPPRADACPAILSVGRQYPRKNTRALIEAMPRVRAAVPDVLLRVVGGGPMAARLEEMAADLGLGDSVKFLGELPDEADVRRAYFEADVFCLPSLQEGFGIVFLEAMAAGLPVVAVRATAVPEVVPDGEAGLLVPPGDEEALSAALIRLLQDADLRARLGRAGRTHVLRYDWPEVARMFVEKAQGII
ncbi:MAG: glycosyltransferase family 4 protein [bacterium]|nr:glycosyltransferase family 4 protein [bacterium]